MTDTSRICRGGPLDGETVTVDCPEGFLAVDRAAGLVWQYRADGGGWVLDTSHDDSLIYPQGTTTGVRRLDTDRVWQAGVTSKIPIIAVAIGQ